MSAALGWFWALMPWSRRIEAAERAAERARIQYERTLAQQPRVEALANELRAHRETNGWTATIATIFGGRA